MENLADISEPQVQLNEKKIYFPSFYSGFNGRKEISSIETE